MPEKHLIDKLGGNRAVAEALNTTASAVANWRLSDRRIPWKYKPVIARMAADKAVQLPTDFWEGVAA